MEKMNNRSLLWSRLSDRAFNDLSMVVVMLFFSGTHDIFGEFFGMIRGTESVHD